MDKTNFNDAFGTGEVSRDDWHSTVLSRNGGDSGDRHFKEIDQDGSNSISDVEFERALSLGVVVQADSGLQINPELNRQEADALLNGDSGSVAGNGDSQFVNTFGADGASRSEWHSTVRDKRGGFSGDRYFKEVDLDGSGTIDEEEFDSASASNIIAELGSEEWQIADTPQASQPSDASQATTIDVKPGGSEATDKPVEEKPVEDKPVENKPVEKPSDVSGSNNGSRSVPKSEYINIGRNGGKYTATEDVHVLLVNSHGTDFKKAPNLKSSDHLVDWSGSRDKYGSLHKLKAGDTMNIKSGGSTQLVILHTDRDLKIVNPGLSGVRNPGVEQTVKGGNGIAFFAYADDEGGPEKTHRVQTNEDIARLSTVQYAKGKDDNVSLFPGDTGKVTGRGNGAQISFAYK